MVSTTQVQAPTSYNQLPLDSLANPHLLREGCKITEDIVKYVLPNFLEGAELCSLAHANKQWKHLLLKGIDILQKWKSHSFLDYEIKKYKSLEAFEIIEAVFFETLERAKPLAEKIGCATELKKVTLHAFADSIIDLNLVSFCEDLSGKPEKESNDTITSYASRLRTWIKNSPAIADVRKITLKGKGLTLIPEEIHFFTRLKRLYLQDNGLRFFPHSIKNLQYLDLSSNELHSFPNGLEHLSQLESLDLSENQLRNLPDGIEKLASLKNLNLSGNQLSLLPDTFGKLTELNGIDLSHNQFTTFPEVITTLPLFRLFLSNNQLQSLPKTIGKLTNLTWLDLGDNQLQSIPESIGNLTNLSWLDLGVNRLKSLPSSIGKLKDLRRLELYNNQFTTLPVSLRDLRAVIGFEPPPTTWFLIF